MDAKRRGGPVRIADLDNNFGIRAGARISWHSTLRPRRRRYKEKEGEADEKWREALHELTFAATDGLKHGMPAKEAFEHMGSKAASE
jgi:hypothetical protein